MEQVRTTGRLAVVNGLRGLAIIGVLFQHLTSAWLTAHLHHVADWRLAFVSNGWTGVNLFFILSGFVLFLPYAAGRRQLCAWGDAAGFYRHRFFRLMPLYYFVTLVLLALGAAGKTPVQIWIAARQLLLLCFIVTRYGFMPPLDYPLWSIGVEILFSIAFPLLVVLIRRLGLSRVLGLALVAALLARIAGRLWNPGPLGPNFISDNLPGRIDEFVLGMVIARVHALGRVPAWAPRLMLPGIALILLAWQGFFRCQYGGETAVMMAPLNDVLDAGFVVAVALVLAAFTYRHIEFGRERNWRALFLWPEPPPRAAAAAANAAPARTRDAP